MPVTPCEPAAAVCSGRPPSSPPSAQALCTMQLPHAVDVLAHDAKLAAERLIDPRNASRLYEGLAPKRAVVLALHGFSVGPWQMDDAARHFTARGLDVLALRLPGHGARHAGERYPAALPDSPQVFVDFAEAALRQARALAEEHQLPLMVFGFSLGGTEAWRITQTAASGVTRLGIIAPATQPTQFAGRAMLAVARWAQWVPYGYGQALLESRHHPMLPTGAAADWPGYGRASFAKILTLFDFADRVWRESHPIDTPTQVFLSASDKTCDPWVGQALVERFARHRGIYMFGPSRQVGHAMVSAQEDSDPVAREFMLEHMADFFADGTYTRS